MSWIRFSSVLFFVSFSISVISCFLSCCFFLFSHFVAVIAIVLIIIFSLFFVVVSCRAYIFELPLLTSFLTW